jgi:DedD protein
MDPQLKQRLVGAAVLVALAVLFIPTFLDTETPPPEVAARDIAPMPAEQIPPLEPKLEPLIVAEIDQGLDASPEELAARIAPHAGATTDLAALQPAATAPTPSEDKAPEPVAPVAKPTPQPAASVGDDGGPWTIQLGSFTSEDNAKSLLAKLQQAGFDAFVSPLSKANKRSYRVRVGTTPTRQEAERLHAQLAQRLGYTGMVVRNE